LDWKQQGHTAYRTARLIVISVVGATLVLIGLVLLFVPGPGSLVLIAGLALLSIEFAWARIWLRRVKKESVRATRTIRRRGLRNYLGGRWRLAKRLWARTVQRLRDGSPRDEGRD
jgi:tellurite resistance protein TerC